MKFFLLSLIAFIVGTQGIAQKFGYIDSEYILSRLPDYSKAQSEIDQLSLSWQQEIGKMQADVNNLHITLEMENVLLTERMRTKRVDEIKKKEIELISYQKKVFGFEGLFFLKKQELIRPLQDKVFEAVRKVAKSNKLAIVFDKAGELIMIYTDPVHDYTDFVLEELDLGDTNDRIK